MVSSPLPAGAFVDLPPVTQKDDQDDEIVVLDFVNDAIVPDPIGPERCELAAERLTDPRILGEPLDALTDSFGYARG